MNRPKVGISAKGNDTVSFNQYCNIFYINKFREVKVNFLIILLQCLRWQTRFFHSLQAPPTGRKIPFRVRNVFSRLSHVILINGAREDLFSGSAAGGHRVGV